ncbi:RdRP-domain-containing protein [Pseudovirgaria hyperparasitica]|uniref:RNA-dependent RNA polymerase n=1 Tax=Pseudovirgaria hyperparasitica TaxID=470096 RepID=A0A6A6W6M6_9PEZI|nr:RdRP-domain-containing protein [Pseudovirgaria hyperparasitica]KAF2757684.1 RdRP-domain-containing protein [Pseudovirgaria hyperparasitica]
MTAKQKNARGFRCILQNSINASDKSWSYTVSLPDVQATNKANLIKAVSVIASSTRQEIQLRYESAPSNRVTKSESLDKLMLISFADFRLQISDKSTGIHKQAPARESAEYVSRLLNTGIILNGVPYYFFGHSNSQLKSRSCFNLADTKDRISEKINAMGDFSKLKTVAKKAKRLGLLFSSAEAVFENLSPERCEDIPDVLVGDYNFTDGCGIISMHLAKELARRRSIVHRNERYLPSVFQIRYRGYKGVLSLEPSLGPKLEAKFRESMLKFKDAADLSFSVVAYSKPYTFGYLNDQIVLLLSALGISNDVLLQKQNQYLDFLARAADENNLMLAFQFLSYCDRTDLVETLLMEGADAVKLSTRKLVLQEYDKMLNKKGEPKCRIMLPKSRLIFGICDPSSAMNLPGRLREGECMVRVTEIGDGIARTVVNTEVLVTRNPCLHPGDLQKFKAVEIPEWSHLRDCIIFSTQGKRPSADLMSGGDLDGDKFFVCWDPDIVPRTVSQPAEYPAGREPVYFGGTSDADRADYFARYTNASLGRVNHLFLDWARLKGAMSPECQQLNRLFSQCVDGVGIKVPPNLEDPPKCPEKTDFVLDVLHRSAEEIIQSRLERGSNQWEGLSFGAMELLLNRDRIAMSEFELIQLTMKWCQAHKVNILDFQDFFDFCTLSDEQKLWISNCLPPSKEAPSLVWNGLLQSELVEPMELKRFQLDDHRLHWKRIFSSGVDRMGRFLETTTRTLELFHKKLIIFSVDERLTLAIYVPRKISRAQEFQVDSSHLMTLRTAILRMPLIGGDDGKKQSIMELISIA